MSKELAKVDDLALEAEMLGFWVPHMILSVERPLLVDFRDLWLH